MHRVLKKTKRESEAQKEASAIRHTSVIRNRPRGLFQPGTVCQMTPASDRHSDSTGTAGQNVRKKVRTISGVTIVSVMTKPLPCVGKCIYCPSAPDTPKSYLPKSPVVLRAIRCNYDPFLQVQGRLRVLNELGHGTDKVELIVMGGTFLSAHRAYQDGFIKSCYDALNDSTSKSLEEAKKKNEKASHRCVGLCIETRPDWSKQNHINTMLDFGATRTELGVQTIDDKSYGITKRGHTIKDVIEATKLLKDSCFKVHYHAMVNLPGSTISSDLKNFKKIFDDEAFRPDGIKIYPCLVIRGTELEEMTRRGEHKPYELDELIELIVRMKQLVPRYTRITRIMRDIPSEYIVSSVKQTHLRDMIHERAGEPGAKCECIRCREVGYKLLRGGKINDRAISLNRFDYDASGGKEIFLSFDDTDNDALIGLLRLRIPSNPFRPEITKSTALVREIHVYGLEKSLSGNGAQFIKSYQHKGYGKKLLEEAERIAKEEFGADKVVVISGVGAREYFRKFGYRSNGPYMTKKLN